MKRVGILGSTGSIGQSALKIIERFPEHFSVATLAAKGSIDAIEKQAKTFCPELVALWDEKKARELQSRIPDIPVLGGLEGVIAAATQQHVDLVLNAISGFEGVLPTLRALEVKKPVALANKEALVAAGHLVTNAARKNQVELIPVDSEHTAIFQCLKGEKLEEVRRIILTASGGPFRTFTQEELQAIDVDAALSHPNYSMGAKVTIDSSTLMNKGLEMIETHFFYDIPLEKIEVVIHPEQVIHSMVEFRDNSIMAQMGEPDMLIPIQVALSHPERHQGIGEPFDFTQLSTLHFSQPDNEKFRCLALSYSALRAGGSMPCFLNAANETLVQRFLDREIGWIEIGQKLETLLHSHTVAIPNSYDDLVEIDREARTLARQP